MSQVRRFVAIAGLALTLLCAAAKSDESLSEAEQLLFLDSHLRNVTVPATLRYRYAKSGSLEPPIAEDQVRLTLAASGTSTQAHVDYLTGPRTVALPDIQAPTSNPVILFFLERDVREMQRLSSGKSAYFRKRVRLALAEAAQVQPVTVQFEGRAVEAVEISVRPYEADPLQPRFANYADKTYAFTLSAEVPGMVYQMHTTMFNRNAKADDQGSRPVLIEETLTFSGMQR
jgi:hypothetical protein